MWHNLCRTSNIFVEKRSTKELQNTTPVDASSFCKGSYFINNGTKVVGILENEICRFDLEVSHQEFKVGCVFGMVISPGLRVGQYRYDDYRELHFSSRALNKSSLVKYPNSKLYWLIVAHTLWSCKISMGMWSSEIKPSRTNSQYQKSFSFGKLSGEIFSSKNSPLQTNELWAFQIVFWFNIHRSLCISNKLNSELHRCWRRNVLVTTLRCWWPIY